MKKRLLKLVLGVGGGAVLALALLYGLPMVQAWMENRREASVRDASAAEEGRPHAQLAADDPETLIVPEEVSGSLGVLFAAVQAAPAPEPLKLDGTLFLDANSMVHVHSRFAGDVVEVGDIDIPNGEGEPGSQAACPHRRQLRFGDQVRKGQLLAAVWSKELGEKKSELVESLSRQRINQEKLKRLEELLVKGSVAERNVREAEKDVESDLVTVARVERTLRSWLIPDEELDLLRREAEELHQRREKKNAEPDPGWARVEVRAPMDGTIVEKNVAVGDYIGNDLDIFKIADLGKLDVLAHAYEEDLPILERLPREQRRWTILLKADPEATPLKGKFDRIGSILDPSQHTALIMGWVDNAGGKLRVGQFVTAQVELPVPESEVSAPTSALVDVDGVSYVFVQSENDPHRLTRVQVFPASRRGKTVSLKCSPPRSVDGRCVIRPLREGERIVIRGGIELAAELVSLQSAKSESVASK